MIAKATVITHGSNAVRYSADKNQAEIVKTNRLPEDISPSAMWSRMVALQYQFREKLNRHRPLKNTSIRIELSPAREETKDWTMADWVRLTDEDIMPDDVLWSTLEDVQHTAILLFANYIDAAISISEDCGGGGGCCAPSSGWGKEDDEDDWKFARRCVNVARYMHTSTVRPKRERSRGFHR